MVGRRHVRRVTGIRLFSGKTAGIVLEQHNQLIIHSAVVEPRLLDWGLGLFQFFLDKPSLSVALP